MAETSEQVSLIVGKETVTDGDFEFSIDTVNGVGMFHFPSTIGNPQLYAKIINDIINFEPRSDDVILATYPKCGTHWAWEIIHMLLQGKSEYSASIKEAVMLELMNEQSSFDKTPSPRVLNSHLPYRWLPRKHIKNGGKIVHVTRNPKDMYVSYFHHARSSNELGIKAVNMSWEQYFNNYIFGKVQLYGTWFFYERDMAKGKSENKNILTLHYENLKMDPIREIKRIAKFLEIQITDELVDEISMKCKFQNLKKANDDVKKIPEDLLQNFISLSSIVPNIKVPEIYRKGEVGDWKNYFTVAQNERFDAWFTEEMKTIDQDVIFEINQESQ